MRLIDLDHSQLKLVQLVPSYRCSRGCHYCYNVHLNQVDTADAAPTALLATLDRVLAGAPGPVEVEVIGGEPLEGESRVATDAILQATVGRPQVSSVAINTAYQSPALLDQYLDLVDRIYLSIDPSRSLLNVKRVMVRPLTRAVTAARDADVELHVSAVLFGSERPADLDAFIDQLRSCGVTKVGFTHEVARHLDERDVERYGALYHHLFFRRLADRVEMSIVGQLLDDLEMTIAGGHREAGCGCGTSSVVIEPDGGISPGVFFDHAHRQTIGADELRAMHDDRTRILRSRSPCATCELWGACGGGCLGLALRESKRTDTRDSIQCAILKGAWARVRRDLDELAD